MAGTALHAAPVCEATWLIAEELPLRSTCSTPRALLCCCCCVMHGLHMMAVCSFALLVRAMRQRRH